MNCSVLALSAVFCSSLLTWSTVMLITVTHCITMSKESMCRVTCMLHQSTNFTKTSVCKVIMTSYYDCTNNIYPVTMTTICHCSKLEFGREACNQAFTPGIEIPLHNTAQIALFHGIACPDDQHRLKEGKHLEKVKLFTQ